jgi:hypothetical protein
MSVIRRNRTRKPRDVDIVVCYRQKEHETIQWFYTHVGGVRRAVTVNRYGVIFIESDRHDHRRDDRGRRHHPESHEADLDNFSAPDRRYRNRRILGFGDRCSHGLAFGGDLGHLGRGRVVVEEWRERAFRRNEAGTRSCLAGK